MDGLAAITTYGERNAQAPAELDLFSFLVGKWSGAGKARLPDGGHAQFELTWIGRYVLNGMAIADEFHSLTPDGKPYLGISLRQFDPEQGRLDHRVPQRHLLVPPPAGEFPGGLGYARGRRGGRRFRRRRDSNPRTLSADRPESLQLQHRHVARPRAELDPVSIEMTMTRVE